MKNLSKVFILIIILLATGIFQSVATCSSASAALPKITATAKSLEDFIPKGWRLNYRIYGDFNKDKLKDIAAVIEEDFKYNQGDLKAPKRILLIAFKLKNNSYALSIQSSKAILKANEGGVFGDPFYEGLSYDRGSLVIDFYGGSNYRWGLTYRFRYQNNGWYLIGATITDLYTGTGEETIKDYNLLTGKMIITTGIEDGELTSKEVNRGKKKLLNLKDFYPWVVAGKDY